MNSKKFYCIWVMTGTEDEYIKDVQPLLDAPLSQCRGQLYTFGKKMKLKKGKEYIAPLFPSYVFLETDKINNIRILQSGKGFIKVLPNNNEIQPLNEDDTKLIVSILKYGTIIPIMRASFDVDDRIRILDGPFKGKEGLITAVNRRNKRVNFEVKLMNGVMVIGLTYELLQQTPKMFNN